jgi:hypothetical protein
MSIRSSDRSSAALRGARIVMQLFHVGSELHATLANHNDRDLSV